MIPSDDAFERFHKRQRQRAELESLAVQASEVIGEAPSLEAHLMAEFVRRARAYANASTDLTETALERMEVRLRPAALEDEGFKLVLPARSLVSLARYGFLSRMKELLKEEKRTPIYQAYEATVPTEDISGALVFGAVPEGKDPYVSIAASPQRVLRLMKGAEAVSFDDLLVSDDTVSVEPVKRPKWAVRQFGLGV